MTDPTTEPAASAVRSIDPTDVIEVVVEIPQGSRNKYEIDHDTHEVWLDRHLFTATRYPADYGFVPRTLAEDGDPLDALVLLEEPTFPGVHIHARPIGVFWMRDEAGPDAKLLCVPANDERYAHLRDLDDIRGHLVAEIGHFFEVYKALEPHKHTLVRDWEGADAAWREVAVSRDRFDRHHAHDGAHAPEGAGATTA